MLVGDVFIPGAIPDLNEAVALGLEGEGIAVNGHEGIDLCSAGFQDLAGPDIADTGEIVGLRGIQKHASTPARFASDARGAIRTGNGAVVQKRGDVWTLLAGNGFHPDMLVGRDLGDSPVDRNAFHDRGGG